MAKYKLVVLTNPMTGEQEDEFNDWYDNIHLDDVVAVPGFISAERFKLKDGLGFPHSHRYLALYEVETDTPETACQELFSRQGTELMMISEALDLPGAMAGLFEPCSTVVRAKLETGKTDPVIR